MTNWEGGPSPLLKCISKGRYSHFGMQVPFTSGVLRMDFALRYLHLGVALTLLHIRQFYYLQNPYLHISDVLGKNPIKDNKIRKGHYDLVLDGSTKRVICSPQGECQRRWRDQKDGGQHIKGGRSGAGETLMSPRANINKENVGLRTSLGQLARYLEGEWLQHNQSD